MTGEEQKYVEAVEQLLDQRLQPLVGKIENHDSRIRHIEASYLSRDDIQRLMNNAIEAPMQQLLTAIEDLSEKVTDNQARIAGHDRRLNPWLRMWDAGREIWDARSKIVKLAMSVGAVSGAFIGIVGVIDLVRAWFM